MGKLVRDRIPEIIREDGEKPVTREVSDEELEKLLREKILEEAEEFSEEGTLDEAADVLQVLKSYMELTGQEFEKVESIRKQKESQRGGFREGVFLEKVE